MPKKPKELNETIAANIAKWHKERVVSDYMREKLSEKNPVSNKAFLDEIIDKAIDMARIEAEPKWTPFLFSLMKSEEKKPEGGNTINFFQLASGQINETVDRLINVTPNKKIKKGIESII